MTIGHLLSQGSKHSIRVLECGSQVRCYPVITSFTTPFRVMEKTCGKMLIRMMLEFLRQVGNVDGCGGGLNWGGQDYSWGTFGHWEPGWFPLQSGLCQMCLN